MAFKTISVRGVGFAPPKRAELVKPPKGLSDSEGEWVRFDPAPPNPKTLCWWVVNKSTDEVLGEVSWFGRWRRYAFTPSFGTTFEHKCLMDIADFCVDQTNLHRITGQRKRIVGTND